MSNKGLPPDTPRPFWCPTTPTPPQVMGEQYLLRVPTPTWSGPKGVQFLWGRPRFFSCHPPQNPQGKTPIPDKTNKNPGEKTPHPHVLWVKGNPPFKKLGGGKETKNPPKNPSFGIKKKEKKKYSCLGGGGSNGVQTNKPKTPEKRHQLARKKKNNVVKSLPLANPGNVWGFFFKKCQKRNSVQQGGGNHVGGMRGRKKKKVFVFGCQPPTPPTTPVGKKKRGGHPPPTPQPKVF